MCAPDRFRVREFRSDVDQLTLDRAFEELRSALEFVELRHDRPGFHVELNRLLDESLRAYVAGEEVAGAHLLQDFQNLIFGPAV